MTSEIVSCPKCNKQFPMIQMHDHYNTCKGQSSQVWQQIQQEFQQPTPTIPVYTPPQVPAHKHQWIESDMYKVCPGCNHISPKLKALWFIFVRYFFAIFWIALFIGILIGIRVHG